MNREQQERLTEKIEYDMKSDMIAQEEKKSNAVNVLMAELIVHGAVKIASNNDSKQFLTKHLTI